MDGCTYVWVYLQSNVTSIRYALDLFPCLQALEQGGKNAERLHTEGARVERCLVEIKRLILLKVVAEKHSVKRMMLQAEQMRAKDTPKSECLKRTVYLWC